MYHSYYRKRHFALILFRESDWKKAVEYYEKYIDVRETETEEDPTSFNEQHDIVARLATLKKTGLECNYRKAGRMYSLSMLQ